MYSVYFSSWDIPTTAQQQFRCFQSTTARGSPQRVGRQGTTAALEAFPFATTTNDGSARVCVSVGACVYVVLGPYSSSRSHGHNSLRGISAGDVRFQLSFFRYHSGQKYTDGLRINRLNTKGSLYFRQELYVQYTTVSAACCLPLAVYLYITGNT